MSILQAFMDRIRELKESPYEQDAKDKFQAAQASQGDYETFKRQLEEINKKSAGGTSIDYFILPDPHPQLVQFDPTYITQAQLDELTRMANRRKSKRNISLTTYKTKPFFGWHTYDRYVTRQYGEW